MTYKPVADGQQVKQFRTVAGQQILWILLLPIPLIIAHFAINETIVFPAQLSQVRTDAGKLVQAIENIRGRTGKYPTRLDELVPIGLERIPTLPGGESFGYKAKSDWYSLTYDAVGEFQLGQ